MNSSAPFTMWFWIIGLSALYVGPPVLIVGSAVWISTRRARRGQGGRDGQNGPDGRAARHARIGRLGGLLVGAFAGAVAFLAGFGLLAPIVVAVGYLVGVLITELRPSRPTGPIRVASLQARNAWQYLPPWVVPAIVATAALALVAPILFIAVPPPTDLQKGWMIVVSLPLALVVVIALAGLVLLMARVAALPQPVSQDQDGAGRDNAGRNRANAARTIAGAVLGIELLALGAMALVASTDVAGPFAHAGAAYLGSRILIWSGLGLSVAGMLAWAMLSRWRPVSAAPPAPGDPGPGDAGSPGPATPRVA